MNERYLPTADTDRLKSLLKRYEEGNLPSLIDVLAYGVLGYYSPMFEGLDKNTGHIIYRLSEVFTPEEREVTMVYPSDDGSILDGEARWDSLEDWRKQWEKYHPIIPPLPQTILSAGEQSE